MGYFWIIVYLATVAAAWYVGQRKNRPVLGTVLGLFLSWIGLIIIAVLPARQDRPWKHAHGQREST